MSSANHPSLTDSGIEAGSTQEGITLIVILVFLSISFYNVLELTLMIFSTFRRRSGLYFWSFVVSTWGIAFWGVGFLLKDTGVTGQYLVYVTILEIGWCSMVTGQSVVLYSRLHIVLHSPRKLRMALWMIIVDAIICHVPIIVVAYGANSPNPGPFIVPYSVYEKVQVTIFFIQELILSGIYIAETIKMMRLGSRGGARKLMKHLVVVNVIIVLLDVTILGLEYAGLYNIQTAYKGLVYSVKLKLEFSILNQLVDMTTGGRATESSGRGGHPTVVRTRIDHMTDKAGIPMESFDVTTSDGGDDRPRKLQDAEYGRGTLGYNAFIQAGEPAPDGQRGGVTRTTEVVIHSDGRRGDTDGDSDSVDGKSGMTNESSPPAGDGTRRMRNVHSASSSEIHFARA